MECVDNSMERISNDLVTFSLLPASRWKNLLNLDVIRVIVYLLIFAKICENVFQFLFQIKWASFCVCVCLFVDMLSCYRNVMCALCNVISMVCCGVSMVSCVTSHVSRQVDPSQLRSFCRRSLDWNLSSQSLKAKLATHQMMYVFTLDSLISVVTMDVVSILKPIKAQHRSRPGRIGKCLGLGNKCLGFGTRTSPFCINLS